MEDNDLQGEKDGVAHIQNSDAAQEPIESQGFESHGNDDSMVVQSFSSCFPYPPTQHPHLPFHQSPATPPPHNHHSFAGPFNSMPPPHGYVAPTMWRQPFILPKPPQASMDPSFFSQPVVKLSRGRKSKEAKVVDLNERGAAGKNKAKLNKSPKADEREKDENMDGVRWKDHWVDQLIHIRGAMHDEFVKPPKQGVNLWAKVATQLASIYPDFDRDSESCRKKWDRVYKQYKSDRAQNELSTSDRKRSCQWYDVVDEYMHNRTSVSQASGSISLEDGEKQVAIDVAEDEDSSKIKEDVPAERKFGSSKVRKIDMYLGKMANIGDAMVEHMKATSREQMEIEKERLELFREMNKTMQGFLQAYEKRNPL